MKKRPARSGLRTSGSVFPSAQARGRAGANGATSKRGLWRPSFCGSSRSDAHRAELAAVAWFGWWSRSTVRGSGGRWWASDVPAASHEEETTWSMIWLKKNGRHEAVTELGATVAQGTNGGENSDHGRLGVAWWTQWAQGAPGHEHAPML
jgi:hypothetical protein